MNRYSAKLLFQWRPVRKGDWKKLMPLSMLEHCFISMLLNLYC